MKKPVLKSIMTIAAIACSFTAIAQEQNNLALLNAKPETTVLKPTVERVNIAEVFKAQPTFVTIKVKNADQSIVVDYKMPNDAFKTELKVQDANGRVVKTFTLNNKGTADFYVSDLFAGVYNYTVMVNGQKLEKGTFELKD